MYNPELDCGIKPGEDEKKSQINHKRGTAAKRIVGGNFAFSWRMALASATSMGKQNCNI